tara:strand:- start:2132 stop:2563 length:432 start_codon:yes stop_codon:yes gene_type:complete
MKINLERINDKYLFEVTNKNGHKVHLDRKYSDDYDVQGASPMELLLMGVAGCSSIDIISILEKQKLQPESYKMEVFGDRESVPGSTFKKIHVELHVEGDIPADRIIRAAQLSFNKYCSVSKNLEKTSEIVHSIVLNGEKIKIA